MLSEIKGAAINTKRFLSLFFSGPGVNKAVLLKIQKEREQEKSKHNVDVSLSHFQEKPTEAYDNEGYVDSESKKERRSRGSSKKVLEKTEGEKEIGIDHF